MLLLGASVGCSGAQSGALRFESGDPSDPAERARNERALRQLQERREAGLSTAEGRLALVRSRGPGWLMSELELEPAQHESADAYRLAAISESMPWLLGSQIIVGDLILEIDGRDISDFSALTELWPRLEQPGSVSVLVVRDGELTELSIELPVSSQ